MVRGPIPWVVALALVVGCGRAADDPGRDSSGLEALVVSGSFMPIGPPSEPPTRIDAGGSCIVDVEQAYATGMIPTGRPHTAPRNLTPPAAATPAAER
jgi:hypothetical protein